MQLLFPPSPRLRRGTAYWKGRRELELARRSLATDWTWASQCSRSRPPPSPPPPKVSSACSTKACGAFSTSRPIPSRFVMRPTQTSRKSTFPSTARASAPIHRDHNSSRARLPPPFTSTAWPSMLPRSPSGPLRSISRFPRTRVHLGQGKDSNDEIVLSLHDACRRENRNLRRLWPISKRLIAKIAKDEAGKHGVTIENVQLTARTTSPRSLEAEVRLRARKLFLSASIRVTGQLDLDSELNARISGLKCKGDGAIAAIACGVLDPHLQKLDGREFPLMSLPLGEIRSARRPARRQRQTIRHRRIRLGGLGRACALSSRVAQTARDLTGANRFALHQA